MYAIEINQFDALEVSGSYVNRTGWIHKGRKLNTNLFVCIEEGTCSFKIDGREHNLQKNDFIIVPQNTFYVPYTSEYCRHWFAHFYGNYLGADRLSNIYKTKDMSSKNILFLPEKGKADVVLLSYLNDISKEVSNNNYDGGFKKNLLFFNALDHIGNNVFQSEENLSAQYIKNYITDNLGKDISLTHIAQHLGYTKQYVIQVFKKKYFTTITRFIIEKRLELSKLYLSETNMKIYEIAQICGFEDANYFSRRFRNMYNLSPQQYRKQKYG